MWIILNYCDLFPELSIHRKYGGRDGEKIMWKKNENVNSHDFFVIPYTEERDHLGPRGWAWKSGSKLSCEHLAPQKQ